MARFAIRNPHVIVVACLVLAIVGGTSLARMPVDLFPNINIPVVVVATFFSGMGSVSETVTRHAHCSVLVVRRRDVVNHTSIP